MVTSSNENEQLISLLALSIDNDYYEEPAWEYLESRNVQPRSHSRQYVINLAWNNGWRPDPVTSVS